MCLGERPRGEAAGVTRISAAPGGRSRAAGVHLRVSPSGAPGRPRRAVGGASGLHRGTLSL
ncbi:hypothetical protein GCM10027168_72380 [Streptomyces capparidis]